MRLDWRTLALLALLWVLAVNPSVAQEGQAVDVAPAAPAMPPGGTAAEPGVVQPATPESGDSDAVAPEVKPVPAQPAAPAADGDANVAEGGPNGQVSGSSPALPVPGPALPQPVAPPGSGTANGGASAIVPPPLAGAAGNAADLSRPSPAAGAAPNAAEGDTGARAITEPGVPQDLQTDERLFGDELPGIAQGQSGVIQGAPGGLLTQKDVEGFSSLLPPTTLPSESVDDRIRQVTGQPAYELSTNFGRLIVPTGTITGSTKTKQFHIDGGLTIYYQQVKMTADTADIDEKQEIAVLKGNVTIDDPKYSLTTDELRIRFEDKLFQATGFVQFKKLSDGQKSQPNLSLPKKDRLREYFAGQQFELYCMDLHYNWDTKQLVALQSVRLVHPSFSGTLDRLDYDDKTKEYAINGNVKLDVTSYDWIFQNQLSDKQDEPRVRAVTSKPTHIECDRLIYSEDSGVAQFYSQPGKQVVFDQTERKITGAYLEVNDKTKDFHVEGSVSQPLTYDQADGEWLFAGGIINRNEASQELKDALVKPLNATAQRLTYNFDRKRLELTGAVKLATEGKVLQADAITHDDTAKFFLMQGNVLIQPDADSKVYAAQVYLDTANDVVSFVGLVQGQFKNDDLAGQSGAAAAAGAGGQVQTPSGLFQTTGNTLPGGARGTSGLTPGDGSDPNVAEGR